MAEAWPCEYTHQQKLIDAAIQARAFLREAFERFDAVDSNSDLSPEGKRRQRAELAREWIDKMEDSRTLERAREAVTNVLQKYEAKISANVKPATDAREIAVHAQIRDRLYSLRDPKERMSFIEKHGGDLTLVSAVLTAPAYLSGLTDTEYAFVQSRLEKQTPPEVIEARTTTQKMLAEVEMGWRAAAARIAKRGGLVKGPDERWSQAA